jgi:hypothetical protein
MRKSGMGLVASILLWAGSSVAEDRMQYLPAGGDKPGLFVIDRESGRAWYCMYEVKEWPDLQSQIYRPELFGVCYRLGTGERGRWGIWDEPSDE